MKIKRVFPVFLFVMISFIMSSCTGVVSNTSWPGVTVSGDMAYVASGQKIHVVNLKNGTEVWSYPEKADPNKPFYAAPILTADGQLLVGEYANNGVLGTLSSLDIKDPNIKQTATKWTFSKEKDLNKNIEATNHWIASPLVDSDTIYAPNANGHIYALTITGGHKWTSTFKPKNAFWSQPVADAQRLYVTSMDHFLYAVNKSDGSEAWKVDLGAAIVSSPLVGPDGTLYIGTLGNELIAVKIDKELNAGKIAWRMTTTGSVWGTPALKDGVLYFGDNGGASSKVYAVSVETEKAVWSQDAGSPVSGSPIILTDRVLFVTETGGLLGFDLSGKPVALAAKPTGANKFYGPLVLAGTDKVLMVSTDPEFALFSMDPAGATNWTFKLPK
jgi:outer membrane protein assembly factor BamB